MNKLLAEVIDAHGGTGRWSACERVEASIVSGGGFFPLKGLIQDADPRQMTVWLHEQRSSVLPYGAPGQRTMFTPDRIAIEKADGTVVAQRFAPADSFAGHQMSTPWDELHRAYFNGEALWTYLTTPFLLAGDGVDVEETEPWRQDGETWRVLRARFPGSVETHSRIQDFFFDDSRMLRRHDYQVNIAGGFPAAQLTSEYVRADGISLPTKGRGGTAMVTTYSELPTNLVSAGNGIDYAYRDTGGAGAAPLVLLQHFRGNLDNWDPALIDALAAGRRVITFDNAGVGRSTGTTSDTFEQMAHDATAFIAAMGLSQVDLLGFSIGSLVAQQVALVRPAIVRRLVLAASAPQGAAGMHGWAPEVIGAVGTPHTSPEGYLGVFFTQSAASRQAGREALARMAARTQDRDQPTTWTTREAQYDAVCTWGIPDHARLQRLAAIEMPVLAANGDSDPMILPRYSYLLAGLIPHARVTIYPDAAHGFLFQHHAQFAADVQAFLTAPD